MTLPTADREQTQLSKKIPYRWGLIEEENCMNTSTMHKAPKEKKLRLASINAVESENYEDNTKHCGSFIGKVFFGVRMAT